MPPLIKGKPFPLSIPGDHDLYYGARLQNFADLENKQTGLLFQDFLMLLMELPLKKVQP
jgi:hypothetical protein